MVQQEPERLLVACASRILRDPHVLVSFSVQDVPKRLVVIRESAGDSSSPRPRHFQCSVRAYKIESANLIKLQEIICPWHYELRDSYLSIPMFIEKGFRVLPASWKNVDATKALIQFGRTQNNGKLLGHMFTTWGVKKEELLQFPPLLEGLPLIQPGR